MFCVGLKKNQLEMNRGYFTNRIQISQLNPCADIFFSLHRNIRIAFEAHTNYPTSTGGSSSAVRQLVQEVEDGSPFSDEIRNT